MNFSKFYFRFLFVFLLVTPLFFTYTLLAQNYVDKTPIVQNDGVPLSLAVPDQPLEIFLDEDNLLFITSENSVLITDGINQQILRVPGKPVFCRGDSGQIALGGRSYLLVLERVQPLKYKSFLLVDSLSNRDIGQITSLFYKNNILYFQSNSKHWKFDGNIIGEADSTELTFPISNINPAEYLTSDFLLDSTPRQNSLFGFRITNSRVYQYINPRVFEVSKDLKIDEGIILGKGLASKGISNISTSRPIGLTFTNDTIFQFTSKIYPGYINIYLRKKENHHVSNLLTVPNSLMISSTFLAPDSSLYFSIQNKNFAFKNPINNNSVIQLYSVVELTRKGQEVLYYGFVMSSVDSTIKFKNGASAEITLCGLDPFYWNNLIYSVKLEGYDKNWSDWSTNQKYIFVDLPYGNYKFKVRAKNPAGVIVEKSLASIEVVPAIYQLPISLFLLFILSILVAFTILRWRWYHHAKDKFVLETLINKRTDELVKEKEKTENLLARVLPRETAQELKETGKVNTQRFNVVTVLFSDIQGFTRITDETNPEVLIDQLDRFFLYFDSVVEKYKIEKIKTIGDAYMCAGGIPQKNRTNPVEVVMAALEMMNYMRELNKQHNLGYDLWDLRIGIDTGPVIAGVVGRKKLTYDIWGSTVNTASRMESSGEIGKINISGNTYMLVKEYFECTYRGKMPVKNKGDIEMYFVEGIKTEYSENFAGIKPNREMEVQIQILRLGDLEELILEKLDKGLPKNLYYHNLKHTVDVYTQVELIGKSENVTKEELLILRTAALFHDSGHMIDYDTHEEMGVKLAREILPEYKYSERQIELISELIMATKMPPRPKNILEAIMCDADLDYLGRTDFIPVSNMLYKELHEHGKIGTLSEWNELQMKFIEKHQYFTNTARRLRNVNKKSQLDNIKQWIEKNNS